MCTDEELFNSMTKRQREVAALLISGEGCDSRSMSARLGLRGDGVRKYLSALCALTGMDNRTALAVFLLRRPLLTALLDGVEVAS